MANIDYNLFRQESSQDSSKWQGAPKLRPRSGDLTVVNIRDDYRWTVSPTGARAGVPVVEFSEYSLDLSSLITSALYKIRGGIENLSAFSSTVGDILAAAGEKNNTKLQKTLEGSINADPLNPYAGMYAASPTGFRYVAPYLEELNQNINNKWGDDQGNALDSSIGNIIKNAGTVASNWLNITNLANITAPGSYAEKPKFFNPGETDSFKVRFPLINTFDAADIVQNWELCYLLTYQNLPNRRSVNLLDPPALYKVTIPGIKQSPIAYISNLSIQHIGNMRNVEIHGRTKPVPEAYMVNITFQDLLLNSKNIFQYALDGQEVVATVTPSKLPG